MISTQKAKLWISINQRIPEDLVGVLATRAFDVISLLATHRDLKHPFA